MLVATILSLAGCGKFIAVGEAREYSETTDQITNVIQKKATKLFSDEQAPGIQMTVQFSYESDGELYFVATAHDSAKESGGIIPGVEHAIEDSTVNGLRETITGSGEDQVLL